LSAGPDLRLEDAGAPGVAAALVAPGEVTWQGSHGIADPIEGRPVTDRTAFLWFSLTKIATATAVMQLAEAGRLGLDSPAREAAPELGIDPRITVRQLLNHSSGIRNPPPIRWIHPANRLGPDPRELASRLLSRYGKPRFEPGSRSAYTNVGYIVLGELVAAASGRPFRDYLIERVLRPIGATATGFDFGVAGEANASTGTHPRRDPLLPISRLLLPRWVIGPAAGAWRTFAPFYVDGSAYGGLVGPVGDAALLAAAHLGGGAVHGNRILGAESVAEMQRIVTRGRRFDLGLGWFRAHRDSERGRTHIEHLGGGPAYGAVMRLYPGREVGVVAMANVSSSRFRYEAVIARLDRAG
jgi:CubicO group peptidase (beta-lactamase class C family)